MSEVPGCEDCDWAPYCNGSCPGLAYEMTGDFNRANPHDCYRSFLDNFDSEEGNLLRYYLNLA
jgi:sulfatase maturation enzyme AslB (radical SAM superfamily)